MGNSKNETEKKYTLRISENALSNITESTGYIAESSASLKTQFKLAIII